MSAKRKADTALSESDYNLTPKKQKVDDDQSQDSEENDGKSKWTSLEHRGVTFFPGYQPHDVKVIFKVIFIFVIFRANL
jgi:hypothetical protein